LPQLVLGYFYAFPRALVGATPKTVLLSAVIAAVNAPLEELLWRGTYVAVFRQSRRLSYVYPNIWFGLWHLAPLSVVPNRAPGGSASFVIASCVVGFLWGWVALNSRSIGVTSVAHGLFDFSGLGGRIYFG
jgi:membrane protease YdiL (CAAX protease family)